MSRGRPDHGRRNLPFSASLRHRWWCDLVIRRRRKGRGEGNAGSSGRSTPEKGAHAGKEKKKGALEA